MADNVYKQNYSLGREQREQKLNQRSKLLWFTGLSGSGKSTLADALSTKLHTAGFLSYTLDGDNIRLGINKGLGFSAEDRTENLRRIAEVSKLMLDAGVITLAAFVSPTREDRAMIREIVGKENFIEIFVNTPLEECEKRDVKGLYKKARSGEIKNFTGISAPYEEPIQADIEIKTKGKSIEDCMNEIFDVVKDKLTLPHE